MPFLLLLLPLMLCSSFTIAVFSVFTTEINKEMIIKGKSAGGCTFLFGIYLGPWLQYLTVLDCTNKLGLISSCLVMDTCSGTALTFSDSSTSTSVPP